MSMDARNVINGLFGKLWFNGEEIAEIKALTAEQERVSGDVIIAGQMQQDTKALGLKLTGEFTVYKVDSKFIRVFDDIQNGVDTRFEIMTELADPDSKFKGKEAVVISNVAISKITLANFTVGEMAETVVHLQLHIMN